MVELPVHPAQMLVHLLVEALVLSLLVVQLEVVMRQLVWPILVVMEVLVLVGVLVEWAGLMVVVPEVMVHQRP